MTAIIAPFFVSVDCMNALESFGIPSLPIERALEYGLPETEHQRR
jgi:hypothetical protein